MSTLRCTNLQDTSGSNSSTTEQIASGRAKAWVNFNGTSTVAIRANFNVSSITDNGTGDYTVNFTTAFADTNYAFTCGGSQNGNTNQNDRFTSAFPVSSSAVRVIFSAWINGNNTLDGLFICFAAYR